MNQNLQPPQQGEIVVSEIAGPAIHDDGQLLGRPAVFVRAASCKIERRPMSADDILDEVNRLTVHEPVLVSIVGNPEQFGDEMETFILSAQLDGHEVAIETRGHIARPWMAQLDYLTATPSPPSSGESTDWQALDAVIDYAKQFVSVTVKVAVFNDDDLNYAKTVRGRYPHIATYLKPDCRLVSSNSAEAEQQQLEKFHWLARRVIEEEMYNVAVLPPLRAMLTEGGRGVWYGAS